MLFFLTGIILVQQLTHLPTFIGVGVMGLLTAVCYYQRAMYLVACFVGVIWAIIFAQIQLSQSLTNDKEGVDLNVAGYIDNLPKQDDRKIRFDFIVDPPQANLPNKLRLNWYTHDKSLKAGQYWHFTVKLKRPHGSLNPYGFDYERLLFTYGIGATGYVRKPPPVAEPKKNKRYTIAHWRQSISDQLDQLLDENTQVALIKALSIGERSQITDQQWKLLSKTGTNHLLAISGLHIGLVAGIVFFFTLKLWVWTGILNGSPQTIAAYSALLAATLYAALAGFSIPTQRALVMSAVAMIFIVYQRHILRSTALSIALFLVLIIDPLAVLSGGFWLSFSAITLIIYCNSKRLGKTGWLISFLKIQVIISLGLAPLTLIFFQQVSIISPLANFVAIPWVSFIIVPLILLALLTLIFSASTATYLLNFADYNLAALFEFLEQLAVLPLATVNHSFVSLPAIIFVIIALLLLYTPKGIPARHLALFFVFPFLFTKQNTLKHNEFRLDLLDVGQGLATVIQTKNHLLVFDTGVKLSESFDMGKMVIIPYLRGIGISEIDRLIISHADNDHKGGMKSLVETLNVKTIYSSYGLAKACLSGDRWIWDGIVFKFLSPREHRFKSKNNNSCVLKVESIYGSALLTGDIEAQAEKSVVNYAASALKSDVLIVPHHGSKTSSTALFLKHVDPKWALIPVGYKNRYRFPHAKALKRYQNQGVKTFSTAKRGALQLTVSDKGLHLRAYRDDVSKYWNFK
ncbi:MAG: DNA internalization-related competence protein ComEC/Rec2 [Methylococcales bacterium]|nr:DNA internalization-related competence protein ComEC/Rec2 [Methylococcales bacterium]